MEKRIPIILKSLGTFDASHYEQGVVFDWENIMSHIFMKVLSKINFFKL